MSMKFRFSIILLVLSFSINAKEEAICGSVGLPEIASESVMNILDTGLKLRELSKKEVEGVRDKLCYQTDSARVSGFKKDVFEKPVLEIYKLSANDKNKNQIVSQFLNTYKNDLICIKQQDTDIKRNVHLYKYALFRSIIDTFDELLLDEDNYTIDFNAYEMVDGKKETVVDYIDKLIAAGRHDKGELLSVRGAITHLGGKRGSEL
jgi:hypothetical protein